MNNRDFLSENNIKKLFLKYEYFQKTKIPVLSLNMNKEIILNILEEMNLPNFLTSYPESIYNQYILDELSSFLWNSISNPLRKFLLKNNISPRTRSPWNFKKIVKARILGQLGRYPNLEIKKKNVKYSFRNGIPILITEEKGKDYLKDDSEVSFLNIWELKLAASIILIKNPSLLNFYFDYFNIIYLDEKSFLGLNSNEVTNLLFELLLIKRRDDDIVFFFSEKDFYSNTYQFSNIDKIKDFNIIYKSINTKDKLLMRTLFYLIKSKMLWTNPCFGEDAISNTLFSLEGALLLIQRKKGYSEKKINIEVLKKIFNSTFGNGRDLFEFIQEGYEKRITIVHANPKNGVEWPPFLMADDYYDYFNISRMLLNYIINNKIIDFSYF
jgi:hypothetical protein